MSEAPTSTAAHHAASARHDVPADDPNGSALGDINDNVEPNVPPARGMAVIISHNSRWCFRVLDSQSKVQLSAPKAAALDSGDPDAQQLLKNKKGVFEARVVRLQGKLTCGGLDKVMLATPAQDRAIRRVDIRAHEGQAFPYTDFRLLFTSVGAAM